MSFIQNTDPRWLEEQYRLWQDSPEQLSAEWRAFFEGFDLGRQGEAPAAGDDFESSRKQSAVQSLIFRYRSMGHLLACTDPLNPCPTSHPQLSLEAFGLAEADLDTVFHAKRFPCESATLREILDILRQTYCRTVGVEFMHTQDPAERQWLKTRMESIGNRPDFDDQKKEAILQSLLEAALFEAFLHRKFIGQKRFSLEGAEVVIPLLKGIIEQAAQHRIEGAVLGMAHRGRLNVLANVFGKPLETLFAEFADNVELGFVGEGDVKYHQGFSADLRFDGEHTLHMTLASNPSHLEAVDPVVEGKCRSRQDRLGQGGDRKVLPLLIHGDAAFAGQGMVAETLNLSQLKGYRTGGTLHVVINNQIGFTTSPIDARSTLYATDVARMLAAPIFHVHGEDPEAAVYAAQLALDYRQTFGKDAVVEIICYRRMGHNEGDEPFFTQPLMYEKIRQRPAVHTLYAKRLVQEGLDPQRIEAMTEVVNSRLEQAVAAKAIPNSEGFRGQWQGIERDWSGAPVETGVEGEELERLAGLLAGIPAGFTPHPKVARLLEQRLQAVKQGDGIDWGNAESLAFASLLAEGSAVRLSGQDSRRGTFNHRHAVLIDNHTGEPHTPLAALAGKGVSFQAYNSMLSEAAVLGFEYGYSLENPHGLTIWEAQFGDFANGAQVIIDQFIASSSSKWDRASGLVMLLPHGYEGQGAEHSSARIERYLQLCAGHNMQVATPSTPAQLFHLLRRQVRQRFRRPLIVFTPKSLLRHPDCRSSLKKLSEGSFREVLPDPAAPETVESVLFCSGKIYYELQARRQQDRRNDVAIVRLEQLHPLAAGQLQAAIAAFSAARRFAWVQEEPENGGAWNHLRPQLEELLGQCPTYIGRPAAAATAVGSHRLHVIEQQDLVDRAFRR